MKFLPSLAAAPALVLALGTAPAFASMELAQKKACLACHAVDKKVLGPSYKDIAKKYATQKGADALLVQKIQKGSSGVWGTMAMPANPQVTTAEAQQLVKWIFTLK